jgi:uncharacterized protein (TIGR03437 family)
LAYRIVQQRWNMNCVRLPLDITAWQREGAAYLTRVAKAVSLANAEGLVAILAAVGTESTGLPGPDTLAFWRAASAAFRDTPGVIFSLYHEPARKNGAGWPAWRDAMQPLVAAIRSAGAQQIIAAPSYQDAQGFQGFTREFYLQDANILYEVHPYFDTAATDAERTANFGNLAGTFPVLAGAWGMPFGKPIPACTAIPRDMNKANELLYQAASYFDARSISWSIADFDPSTTLDKLWTCDATSDPATGLGQFILLWLTGDPAGFGSLQASQIASAAGGFPGPIAPGEILSIYGQGIGPINSVSASLDANGRLPVTLSDTQVFFDGIAAPLFVTGAFQVNVQVPWEIAGRGATIVQLIYRGVPSNTVELTVTPAAPELFTLLGTVQAAVINQDGAVNDAGTAAPRGSIVSFFATGAGQTVPASATATPSPAAGSMVNTVTLRMANTPVEVTYAGPAPGLVGVTQINAVIPATVPIGAAPDRVSVILSVTGVDSRNGITFWVK